MARVALLCADLLFGSKVEGGLGAAGHEVRRFASSDEAAAALSDAEVLVCDLTVPEPDGIALVRSLRTEGGLSKIATLGFYSHVDTQTRRQAEQAGFDRIVPRSRMARDMAGLVDGLLSR